MLIKVKKMLPNSPLPYFSPPYLLPPPFHAHLNPYLRSMGPLKKNRVFFRSCPCYATGRRGASNQSSHTKVGKKPLAFFGGVKACFAKQARGLSWGGKRGNRAILSDRKPPFSSRRAKPVFELRVGDFCELKVTALGPKNVGIDEFSYGYSILIPNAQLGETVKAQIIKLNLKKAKYAVAKKISVVTFTKDTKPNLEVGAILTVKLNNIAVQTDSTFIGIVDSDLNLPNQYQLLIPLNNLAQVGQEIKIKITRLKSKYGFAKLVEPESLKKKNLNSSKDNNTNETQLSLSINNNNSGFSNVFAEQRKGEGRLAKNGLDLPLLNATSKTKAQSIALALPSPSVGVRGKKQQTNGLLKKSKVRNSMNYYPNRKFMLTKGSKITFTLPRTAKKYAKHIVMLLSFEKSKQGSALYSGYGAGAPLLRTPLEKQKGNISDTNLDQKENPYVLFIKNQLGAKLGDQVRVKFTKIGSTFAIGKVVRISPNSALKKLALTKKNINEMLFNGMHYGEKVVKCQARMRNYIWNRQTGEIKNPLIKKGRHLINLLKTRRCLNIGLNQLTKYAAKGRTFLFVGTKKPAAGLIARAALFSKTAFFVNTRWLGGMLTNWKTIIKSISKIRPILKEKQKVISNILQKRAKIQNRLIKKVLSLRKKSKVLIKKGKQLIQAALGQASLASQISSNPLPQGGKGKGIIEKKRQNSNVDSFSGLIKSEKLNRKRKELFERGQFLLQKRLNLLNKQNEIKENTANIQECGFLLANKYKKLYHQFSEANQKLNDIRLIFQLNKELRKIKKIAKKQGKSQYTLSYGKFKQLSTSTKVKNGLFSSPASPELSRVLELKDGAPALKTKLDKKLWLIPNPPQEILNKILITINEISINKQKLVNTPSLRLNIKEKNIYSNLKNLQTGLNNSSQDNPPLVDSLPFTSDPPGVPLVILTKLLSKFSRFLPYIKNAIHSMFRLNPLTPHGESGSAQALGVGIIQLIEDKLTVLKINLKHLKKKLTDYLQLNKKINAELELIQTKYTSEQQIIRILRRKLKRHEAEKKLLQFLPKLRYLPTPKSKISLAIQLLMKRFVDPKMKYPMDLIYDEKLKKKSKKVAAARKKKWQRLETYFGGIANMTKLKKTQISKNVAIIIGQQEEMNAVRECKKLGIKMFHIVDTNCNPGLADHFIPSNDDSQNSIKYILTKIITRIRLAQKIRLRFSLLKN